MSRESAARAERDDQCECRVCGRVYVYDRAKGHTRARCNSCGSNRATRAERTVLKRRMVAYKGGRCSICSYDSCIEALCFHHVDPESKTFTIAGRHGLSWTRLRQELDKCVLLCKNCHVQHHAVDAPSERRSGRGGRPPAPEDGRPCRCANCGREYRHDFRKGHGRRMCNSCRSNRGGRAARESLKRALVGAKGGQCQLCGYDACLAALCSHHVHTNAKRFTLAGSHLRSWTALADELEKCVLLCQNCHAKVHAGLNEVRTLIRKPTH
jgi:hypothetical protein